MSYKRDCKSISKIHIWLISEDSSKMARIWAAVVVICMLVVMASAMRSADQQRNLLQQAQGTTLTQLYHHMY